MKKSAIALAAVLALGAGAAYAASGEEIYKQRCFACHDFGAAGAPKLGDKAAWAPRIAKGMDTLLQHAMNGFNAMPPKGTCAECSEADIRAAIEYMINKAK